MTAAIERVERPFARVRTMWSTVIPNQVNYTFRMEGVFSGHAESLFADLAAAHEGRYSTFLDLGGIAVCSASPELFFERAEATGSPRRVRRREFALGVGPGRR